MASRPSSARGPPQTDLLLDQTPQFDPAEPESVPDFDFDQSVPDEFDFEARAHRPPTPHLRPPSPAHPHIETAGPDPSRPRHAVSNLSPHSSRTLRTLTSRKTASYLTYPPRRPLNVLSSVAFEARTP